MAVPLPTTRLRPLRLILTSPASPEADSRLVKETTATVSAKTRSDHVGEVPRWIGFSSVPGLKNSTSPSTTMNPCSTRSPASRHGDPACATSAEATDVAQHHQRDEGQRQAQRRAAVAQRAPEHAHVLRRRVRRDGDQDDVVEQDRPAGDEAHELVEGVAGEHGRTAPLGVQRGTLDVGHRRQREQQRRDQEDDRRQPQRVTRDHSQGEVDGARQRRVDDREDDRRADAAADDA